MNVQLEKEYKSILINIKSSLNSTGRNNFSESEIQAEYQDFFEERIDFKKFFFTSLSEFLIHDPDGCFKKTKNGVSFHSTKAAHIEEMLKNQKTGPNQSRRKRGLTKQPNKPQAYASSENMSKGYSNVPVRPSTSMYMKPPSAPTRLHEVTASDRSRLQKTINMFGHTGVTFDDFKRAFTASSGVPFSSFGVSDYMFFNEFPNIISMRCINGTLMLFSAGTIASSNTTLPSTSKPPTSSLPKTEALPLRKAERKVTINHALTALENCNERMAGSVRHIDNYLEVVANTEGKDIVKFLNIKFNGDRTAICKFIVKESREPYEVCVNGPNTLKISGQFNGNPVTVVPAVPKFIHKSMFPFSSAYNFFRTSDGVQISIKITQHIGLSEFYATNCSRNDKLRQITDKATAVSRASKGVTADAIYKGMPCLTSFKTYNPSQFYRGVITKMSDSQFTVFAVDTGMSSQVLKADELKSISEELLADEVLAIRCRILGVNSDQTYLSKLGAYLASKTITVTIKSYDISSSTYNVKPDEATQSMISKAIQTAAVTPVARSDVVTMASPAAMAAQPTIQEVRPQPAVRVLKPEYSVRTSMLKNCSTLWLVYDSTNPVKKYVPTGCIAHLLDQGCDNIIAQLETMSMLPRGTLNIHDEKLKKKLVDNYCPFLESNGNRVDLFPLNAVEAVLKILPGEIIARNSIYKQLSEVARA